MVIRSLSAARSLAVALLGLSGTVVAALPTRADPSMVGCYAEGGPAGRPDYLVSQTTEAYALASISNGKSLTFWPVGPGNWDSFAHVASDVIGSDVKLDAALDGGSLALIQVASAVAVANDNTSPASAFVVINDADFLPLWKVACK